MKKVFFKTRIVRLSLIQPSIKTKEIKKEQKKDLDKKIKEKMREENRSSQTEEHLKNKILNT